MVGSNFQGKDGKISFYILFTLKNPLLGKSLSYEININHARTFLYVYLTRCMCLPTTEKDNIFPYMLYVLNQNSKEMQYVKYSSQIIL